MSITKKQFESILESIDELNGKPKNEINDILMAVEYDELSDHTDITEYIDKEASHGLLKGFYALKDILQIYRDIPTHKVFYGCISVKAPNARFYVYQDQKYFSNFNNPSPAPLLARKINPYKNLETIDWVHTSNGIHSRVLETKSFYAKHEDHQHMNGERKDGPFIYYLHLTPVYYDGNEEALLNQWYEYMRATEKVAA